MKNYANEEICKKRKRKEKNIERAKLVIVIIISVVVIYNLTLIFQSITKPDKTPSFLGKKSFTIISGSMEPEITIGDIVIVEEVKEEDLKIGDIITFRKSNEMITHRITEIEEVAGKRKYITKGDSNLTEDAENVFYKDIEGKVVKTIKYVGKITILLKDKLTVLAIIFIFIIMYILDIRSQNKMSIRRNKKELLNKRRE